MLTMYTIQRNQINQNKNYDWHECFCNNMYYFYFFVGLGLSSSASVGCLGKMTDCISIKMQKET